MKTVFAVLAALAAVAMARPGPTTGSLRQGWSRIERTNPQKELKFTVAMPMSNVDALETIFWAVSDPASPQYGQFKSFEELNELTATPDHVANPVRKYLAAQGANCNKLTGDSLECSMPAGKVEAMLQTKVFKFQNAESKKLIHRVDADHVWPAELEEGVLFLEGLTNFPHVHGGRSVSAFEGAVEKDISPDYAVLPVTIYNFYGVSSATPGSSSVSVAPAEFEDDQGAEARDVSRFVKGTGVDSFAIQHTSGSNSGSDTEATLDVEYAGATASGSQLNYINNQLWMYTFAQHAVSGKISPLSDVITISWGWSEAEQCQSGLGQGTAPCKGKGQGGSSNYVTTTNAVFMKIGAAGHSLVVASGDSGAHGRSDPSCSSEKTFPTYPGASPYVTTVGATQIKNGQSSGASEPVCQSQFQCATGGTEIVCSTKTGALITSGGGFSNVASQPSYQSAAVNAYLAQSSLLPPSGDFNAQGRGYPDVAALGHNYEIFQQGSWEDVDGTSCACPVVGGLLTLVNAHLVSKGKAKLGFANPWLYSMYASCPQGFNDITQGNNDCTEQSCCKTGFAAGKGWDATTGLGSLNVDKLIACIDAQDAAKNHTFASVAYKQ